MKTYQETWQAMRELAQCCNASASNIELEALAHKYLMEFCFNEEYIRKSFRACVAHVETERGGKFHKSYTKVFSDSRWCQRIVAGKPL